MPWPNAGTIATSTFDPFTWDVFAPGYDPLCVAPLDQIISAIVPGMRFESFLQPCCGSCHRDLVYRDSTTTYLAVPAETTAQIQKALNQLLVIVQVNRTDVRRFLTSAKSKSVIYLARPAALRGELKTPPSRLGYFRKSCG